jgi:hypothetical protein
MYKLTISNFYSWLGFKDQTFDCIIKKNNQNTSTGFNYGILHWLVKNRKYNMKRVSLFIEKHYCILYDIVLNLYDEISLKIGKIMGSWNNTHIKCNDIKVRYNSTIYISIDSVKCNSQFSIKKLKEMLVQPTDEPIDVEIQIRQLEIINKRFTIKILNVNWKDTDNFSFGSIKIEFEAKPLIKLTNITLYETKCNAYSIELYNHPYVNKMYDELKVNYKDFVVEDTVKKNAMELIGDNLLESSIFSIPDNDFVIVKNKPKQLDNQSYCEKFRFECSQLHFYQTKDKYIRASDIQLLLFDNNEAIHLSINDLSLTSNDTFLIKKNLHDSKKSMKMSISDNTYRIFIGTHHIHLDIDELSSVIGKLVVNIYGYFSFWDYFFYKIDANSLKNNNIHIDAVPLHVTTPQKSSKMIPTQLQYVFSLLPVEKLKLTLPELHYNNFNDKEFTEVLYEKWVDEYLMNKISKYVGSSITQRIGIDYNNLKKTKTKFYRMIGKLNFFN